ncbi:MAG: hypothetical protein HY040_22180 [Planctomycetes bacterium]|nr:hypothetical protein [Planctomycetota bacterium]
MPEIQFAPPSGERENVAWVPCWYELDQPLEVGQSGDFAFWWLVPEHLRGPERLVLCNDFSHSGNLLIARGTIAAIRHPELGAIRKINTRGLDYTITLADGTELLVNAEEDPGKLYERDGERWAESPRVISNWRFVVEFESLSEPKPQERVFKPMRSTKSPRFWFMLGGIGLLVGAVGFVLGIYARHSTMLSFQVMTTLPVMLALISIGNALSLARAPLEVCVAPQGLRIKTRHCPRQYTWDKIGWSSIQNPGLDFRRHLRIYDTSGRRIANLSDVIGGFDELAELVGRYIRAKGGETADRIQLAKAKRAAVVSAIAGLVCLGISPSLAWLTYSEQRAERLLREVGVSGEADVEELYLASNGVTPRLVYRITTPDGRSAKRDAQLHRSLWDAFQRVKTISVVYVPEEPEISRLEFGEDPEGALKAPLLGYGASVFFELLALGALAMSRLLWHGWTIDFDKAKGRFAARRYGTGK